MCAHRLFVEAKVKHLKAQLYTRRNKLAQRDMWDKVAIHAVGQPHETLKNAHIMGKILHYRIPTMKRNIKAEPISLRKKKESLTESQGSVRVLLRP